MERRVAIALVTTIVGIASQGCGEVDEGQHESDRVETVQSALGSFGAWNFGSGRLPLTPEAPALARGTGTASLTAFLRDGSPRSVGGGGILVTTQNASSGNWSFSFTNLDSPQFGPVFTAGPGAVLLDVPQGPLVNHYAIVAKRAPDNQYYLTIRDQSGKGTVQQWSSLSFRTFSSAPAVTFIPQSSSVGPQRTLVVTGLGDDGVVYWATNQLAAGFIYHHEAWTSFQPLPGGTPPNQTFVGAPTITFACQNQAPFGPAKSSMALAITGRDSNGTLWHFWQKFDGVAWSGWSLAQNGNFQSGPALAGRPGCSYNPEISLFGVGEDDQLWVTTQLSGGAPGYTQLPLAPQGPIFDGEPNPPLLPPHFVGAPSAVGTVGRVNVAEFTYMGEMTSNSAVTVF